MSGLTVNQTKVLITSFAEDQSILLMHIQADTSLFTSGTLRAGPVVDVVQDGAQLVVVVFWATQNIAKLVV